MVPKVSVIVPIYKAEKYIERCVMSLLKQTLEEIEDKMESMPLSETI